MFRYAVVRRPARSLVSGLTSSPHLGAPVFEKALRQHDDYIRALETCGLSVTVLEALEAGKQIDRIYFQKDARSEGLSQIRQKALKSGIHFQFVPLE